MPLRSFNDVLDECLAAIAQGHSIQTCLDRFPQHSERLRPLLVMAERVRQTPQLAARPWPQNAAWQRVRQRAAQLREPGPRFPRLGLGFGGWLKPVVASLALIFALFVGAGGAVLAAEDSRPDSPLYRVKLATEEVRLWFVFDDVHRAEVMMDQSDERMSEIISLVNDGKPAPGNALSALGDRNERAAEILADHPDEPDLLAELRQRAGSHEEQLIALFQGGNVRDSAYDDYAQAIAASHNARLLGSGDLARLHPEELAEGMLTISGEAQQVSSSVWVIGGVEVRVDERTVGYQNLQPGTTASFIVGKNSRGQLHALSLTPVQTDSTPTGSFVSGQVERVTNEGIVIGGQLIPITKETLRSGEVKAGQKVQVKLNRKDAGVVAASVRPAPTPPPASAQQHAPFTFEGIIEGDVSKSSEWKIGGLLFIISSNTAVDAKAGKAQDGARALVEAASDTDGTLCAQSVMVLAGEEGDADDVYLFGLFEDSRDGIWQVSGLELVPPERNEEPKDGTLLAIEARRHGSDIEVRSATVVEAPDETDLVRLSGIINSLDGGQWSMDFGQVRVASNARFSGADAQVGARAIVWGRLNLNGVFEASYARVLDESPVVATPTPSAPVPTTPPVGTAGP